MSLGVPKAELIFFIKNNILTMISFKFRDVIFTEGRHTWIRYLKRNGNNVNKIKYNQRNGKK